MRITLAQIAPKLSRSNLADILDIIQRHKDESDLIVFPELSLNGYILQDKLLEDAWTIDELEQLAVASKAIDIVVGAAIKEKGYICNSALYFSNGELLSKHDKVHLPNYGMFEEARYFHPGKVFESFKSQFGKTCMLVCEDLWHESVHKELMVENPDYIIALVASPARGFTDDGLEIEKQWLKIIKTVSKECNAKLIFVNRVGFEDGLGFWGGSCILNEKAEVLERFPHFKTMVQTFAIKGKK